MDARGPAGLLGHASSRRARRESAAAAPANLPASPDNAPQPASNTFGHATRNRDTSSASGSLDVPTSANISHHRTEYSGPGAAIAAALAARKPPRSKSTSVGPSSRHDHSAANNNVPSVPSGMPDRQGNSSHPSSPSAALAGSSPSGLSHLLPPSRLAPRTAGASTSGAKSPSLVGPQYHRGRAVGSYANGTQSVPTTPLSTSSVTNSIAGGAATPESDSARVDELTAQVTALKAHAGRLILSRKTLERERNLARKEVETNVRKVRQLHEQTLTIHEIIEATCEVLDGSNRSAQHKLEIVEHALLKLREVTMDEDLEVLHQSRQALLLEREKSRTLEEDLVSIQSERDTMERENEVLRLDMMSVQSEREAYERENEALKLHNVTLQSRVDALEREKDSDSMKGSRNTLIQHHMDRVAALAVEKEGLEEQLRAMEEELAQCDQERDDIETELDDMQVELNLAVSSTSYLALVLSTHAIEVSRPPPESPMKPKQPTHDKNSESADPGPEPVPIVAITEKIARLRTSTDDSIGRISQLKSEKLAIEKMVAAKDESNKELSLRYSKLLEDCESLQTELAHARDEATRRVMGDRGEREKLATKVEMLEMTVAENQQEMVVLQAEYKNLQDEKEALEQERGDWLKEYMTKLEELSTAKYQLESQQKSEGDGSTSTLPFPGDRRRNSGVGRPSRSRAHRSSRAYSTSNSVSGAPTSRDVSRDAAAP